MPIHRLLTHPLYYSEMLFQCQGVCRFVVHACSSLNVHWRRDGKLRQCIADSVKRPLTMADTNVVQATVVQPAVVQATVVQAMRASKKTTDYGEKGHSCFNLW